MSGAFLAACGGDSGGSSTLTWYINPDSGGQAAIAERCTEESDGAYRIETAQLPREAAAQREQLVRRLAANDSSIDLMSLDPPFIPEFAEAGFLAEIPEDRAAKVTEGVVESAIVGSTWKDELVAIPFWANTQLLWYRKSVAEQAGLDMEQPVTWEQIVTAAEEQDKLVGAQGIRAEALTVWINALVESAGGSVITDPAASPEEIELGLTDEPAQKAAEVMKLVADSGTGGPAFSTQNEDSSAAGFESDRGGFMVNWPFVWPRANDAVEGGSLEQSVPDDYGWTSTRGGGGRGEPSALRRDQPGRRQVQRAHRPGLRSGPVHHQRGDPGRGTSSPTATRLQGGRVRRPEGDRGVPDGPGHPRLARAGGPPAADRPTTTSLAEPGSGSTPAVLGRPGPEPASAPPSSSRPCSARRSSCEHHDAAPAGDKTEPRSAPPGKVGISDRARAERKLGWMLAGPAFAVMLLVTAYPILQAIYESLFDFRLTDPDNRSFTWFSNYYVVLTDRIWWISSA
jgi:hypothetical protein